MRDTGIGIAAADLPYVFQRFWQAHTGASREFSGLGIGLALARHLVELHGGTIAADERGPRSRVHVSSCACRSPPNGSAPAGREMSSYGDRLYGSRARSSAG